MAEKEQEVLGFFESFVSNPIGTLVSFTIGGFKSRRKKRKARRKRRAAFAQFTADRLRETERATKFITDQQQLRSGVQAQLSRATEERIELANVVGAGPGIPVPLAISEFLERQRPGAGPLIFILAIAFGIFFFVVRR